MNSARETALRLLQEHRKKQSYADLLFKERAARLDAREAALCAQLFYGVLQNQYKLDYLIAHFSSVPLKKMQHAVWDCLRLGFYQLAYLDGITPYAAVSETVTLARKRAGERAASFVNGVLRAAVRVDTLPEPPHTPFASYLSIEYSQPIWQIEEYIARLGAEEAHALAKAHNRPAPLWVQINPAKRQLFWDAVRAQEITATPHETIPDCCTLSGAGAIAQCAAFTQGTFIVADPAARLAVWAAAPKPGETVLDACAAPGGKTFMTAFSLQDSGRILAYDQHAHKILLLQTGVDRLGLTCVETASKDAGLYDPTLDAQFDLVIADLPCSGLGVLRKKPDIRFKPQQDADALPAIQTRLLTNLARYVRPGGRLLYSTCTLRHAENEQVTAQFLETHPQYASAPFTLPDPWGSVASGQLTLWPHRDGTDGFYISLLRRLT